jgi:hypothetical protein
MPGGIREAGNTARADEGVVAIDNSLALNFGNLTPHCRCHATNFHNFKLPVSLYRLNFTNYKPSPNLDCLGWPVPAA